MSAKPPGFLSPSSHPEVLMMLCTAGHVDHGKTSLVKLLTGCSTDRLKAEQERGLTIELGFAPCFLGGEKCVGIVDVPGHEKFIKNMVAGVSGIAMTVLVIAADDGVMPQTVEHLDIMNLLGVRRGMVALTKIDLVSDDRLREVQEEVRTFLEGTFLRNAPVTPVSSRTGEGLDRFYEVLLDMIGQAEARSRRGTFRMPVERSFVQEGFGTVATGIPVAGEISVGDQVELVPGGRKGRIRGIQCFLRTAESGGCGQCLALNIPDFGKEPPLRGQVLCLPGSLEASALFHVRLQTPAVLDPPIRNAEEVKFHAGTGETPAHVYLLEEATAPGSSEVWATIVCDRPVAAARGDRFILRRNAPPSTVAGGWICSTATEPRRPRKKVIQPRLEAAAQSWEECREDAFLERLVLTTMRIDFPFGVRTSELARATSLNLEELTECLVVLEKRGVVVQTPGPHWIHRADMETGLERMREDIKQARGERKLLSLVQADFLKGWPGPVPVGSFLLHKLEQTDKIQLRGGKILLSDGLEGLPDQDRGVAQEILGILRKTGFASPRPDELPELVKASPDRVDRLLRYLADHGALYRIGKNVLFDAEWMVRAQNMAVEIIQKAGTLDSADFKHHIGSSRKYALAILDFLDTKGITQRSGNFRKLAPNYQNRLL